MSCCSRVIYGHSRTSRSGRPRSSTPCKYGGLAKGVHISTRTPTSLSCTTCSSTSMPSLLRVYDGGPRRTPFLYCRYMKLSTAFCAESRPFLIPGGTNARIWDGAPNGFKLAFLEAVQQIFQFVCSYGSIAMVHMLHTPGTVTNGFIVRLPVTQPCTESVPA